MFDEPYRWIDAIHQRRDYIAEQLDRATPVIGISVSEGILLVSYHRQNPKIYELYDRIALAGIGHPADLETVRGILLNMAHVEGFQRSVSDVSIERLALFGLAPRLKAAYEDISAPPIILDVLLSEVGRTPSEDRFIKVSFDGNLERSVGTMVLAPTEEVDLKVAGLLKERIPREERTLRKVVSALPGVFVETLFTREERGLDDSGNLISPEKLSECERILREDRQWEGVFLDRQAPSRIKKLNETGDFLL
ncbi:MAG: 20S proteasome subunit A/B [Nitrospiraceae bacterium]|nr:20S proteasome subunit A/B [Nitrospirota bacterium]MDA8149754.1 20S proteasome subunit A/B [Nitrospiraceae bacterium]